MKSKVTKMVLPIELGELWTSFLKAIRGNQNITKEYYDEYEFLDWLCTKHGIGKTMFSEKKYITSGSTDYRRCLIIKLCLIPKRNINPTLNYALDTYESGGKDKYDAFKKFLNNSFIEELETLKYLWKCDKLTEEIVKWKIDNKSAYKEKVQSIYIKVMDKEVKEIILKGFSLKASEKTKKNVASLFKSSLKSPIEVELLVGELAIAFNTLKKLGFLSSIDNVQVAKWVSKCFKVRDRSSLLKNAIKYKESSWRTIYDIFTYEKKGARFKKKNIFRELPKSSKSTP